MNEYKVRPARREDLPLVRALLREYSLPTDGLEETELWVAVSKSEGKDEEFIGCGGLEVREDEALLRSLAVVKKYQRKGTGSLLVKKMIGESEKRGVSELYLLTRSANRFFETKFGFSPLSVEEKNTFRGRVRESKEFQGACPGNSILMMMKIPSTVRK